MKEEKKGSTSRRVDVSRRAGEPANRHVRAREPIGRDRSVLERSATRATAGKELAHVALRLAGIEGIAEFGDALLDRLLD